MLKDTLQALFRRDLEKLKEELAAYRLEANIWRIENAISNSAGNLCLHLIGNQNTYIGAELGGTGYVRNRPAEFSLKDVPRGKLIAQITATMQVIDAALTTITEAQWQSEYPQDVANAKVSTGFFLVHLATHLSFHLGQVNYHRRLIDL